ncbi:tRNA-modifying protein YgfZ [hydrothermal vent metagenome]|uniref:tRNA-modifying protein YgfZ n=1 Tax=hydrothermal vent metagenome TaxID=652676 RepID=A0A3B0RYP0_9ZZZZ
MLTDPIPLPDRAIITLCGPNRKPFLQGLITNNIDKLSANNCLYAALLTPQGKYLHDFFIMERDEILYLDCERDRLADLFRRLMMYRLRAKVDIVDCSEKFTIFSAGSQPEGSIVFAADPRHPNMGHRLVLPAENAEYSDHNAAPYDQLRLSLGLPDGSRDFDVDKTLILEGNMEELHGVDFDKGCYVGQEVTARMKHRTSLKKRLLPVTVKGDLPARSTEITDANGKKVGDIRSGFQNRAMGYFRLAHMTFGKGYHCGEATITPWRPDWLKEEEI